jgi:ATP-binding cassette subfamily C (CFTR/MRP) protein 1
MRFQLNNFPTVLMAVLDARVSLERIRNLLLRDELAHPALVQLKSLEQRPVETRPEGHSAVDDTCLISLSDATFVWDEPFSPISPLLPAPSAEAAATKPGDIKKDAVELKETESFKLIVPGSITIKRGTVTAVVGPVGSGKSTFLNALLGELKRTSGSCTVRGSIAWVPQTARPPNFVFNYHFEIFVCIWP